MQGIYVASVSPFTAQNEPDLNALTALMERHLTEGADGFFLGGSSAECFLLTEQERISFFEAASAFKNRTSLIAHVGALSTEEAVRYAKSARSLGYQHVAATPPFYYGFTAAQIAQYYYDIADAAGMPVIIYNFPGNTNKPLDLTDPATLSLLRSDAVFGIKHTNLNLFQLERIRQINPKLTLMNGFDETMVAGLALGADGSIGSTFNIMLPHYRKIYDTYQSGDGKEALRMQVKANNIMEALCRAGLIPAIKYVLQKQGYPCGNPRRPFFPLEEEQQQVLDRVLSENLIQ